MVEFEKGIVHTGSWDRLGRVMDRAAAGQEITVGFIGGSITQGSLATAPRNCYAYLVYRWWAERFAKVSYINAGIGGTTSQFGVARVREDLLRYGPDVVFVEFSVNDAGTEQFQETYEGLVRCIYATGAAGVLLHNICYDTGISAEDIHLQIGKHYDLPCISVRPSIYSEVVSGRLPNREITPDDLHPNDAGHQLVAGLVIHLLDRVYRTGDRGAASGEMPPPLTRNRYEQSFRYRVGSCSPVLQGFVPDDRPQEHITQMFRRGYTAWKAGQSITFEVESTALAVQYRKSVRKPAPVAVAIIDGDEAGAVVLDANFQEDWGDCLYTETILFPGERKRRRVEIRIVQSHEKDAVPFYLASVIGSK